MIVNGERIDDAVIQGEIMRLRRSGAPQENAAETAKENVISQVLVRQQARNAQIAVADNDIEVELMRLYAESGGKERFLQQHRLTEKDEPRLRAHVTEDLRIRRLVDQVTHDVTPPTPEEIRAFFDEHPDRFVTPEQVRVSHVVKRPKGQDDIDTYNQMVNIRKRLLDGEDFATLANECSECSEEPDGDLGFFARGKMVEQFEAVVFSMNVGEISPVFLTQFGYHIATLTGREPAHPQAFDEVKDNIAAQLLDQRKDATFTKYLESLRAAADIAEITETVKPAKPAAGKKAKGKRKKKR
jgi:parvulin-like peptidyl-prolyl isomerase